MKNKKKTTQCILASISVFLLVLCDQLTKIAAIESLKNKPAIELIPGVFQLQYLENRGAAFGTLQNQRWLFLMIVCIVLAAVVWSFVKMPTTKHYTPLRIVAVFVAAGAIGNMIDRLKNGFVVDFFYFSLIDFPIFNVADIYVTVSMAVLFLLILTLYKDDDFHFLKP